jgi:uncharacterized protein with PIN domain
MKFLVDRMLGKLAKTLRLLGYDATYYQGEDRYQLYRIGRQEARTILTRNTKLLPKRPEDQIVHILADRPALQVRELIAKGYVTLDENAVFSRCLLCNATLGQIPRENVEGKVPNYIFYHHQDFFQCPQCGRIYWPGTHQKNMERWVEKLFKL